MAAEKKVVDASVVAKWFLDEEDSGVALKLRADHLAGRVLIVVPELLFVGVMNALRYKKSDEGFLLKANDALWDIQLGVEKLGKKLMEKAIETSIRHKVTLYDATYIAFANLHNAPLVTADKELEKIPNVTMLSKSI